MVENPSGEAGHGVSWLVQMCAALTDAEVRVADAYLARPYRLPKGRCRWSRSPSAGILALAERSASQVGGRGDWNGRRADQERRTHARGDPRRSGGLLRPPRVRRHERAADRPIGRGGPQSARLFLWKEGGLV